MALLQRVPNPPKAWDGWYWGTTSDHPSPTWLRAPEGANPFKLKGFISLERPPMQQAYSSKTIEAIMTHSTDLALWEAAMEEKGERFLDHLNSMLLLNSFNGNHTTHLVIALLERIAELEGKT